jgi:hypothetical protein
VHPTPLLVPQVAPTIHHLLMDKMVVEHPEEKDGSQLRPTPRVKSQLVLMEEMEGMEEEVHVDNQPLVALVLVVQIPQVLVEDILVELLELLLIGSVLEVVVHIVVANLASFDRHHSGEMEEFLSLSLLVLIPQFAQQAECKLYLRQQQVAKVLLVVQL